MDFRPYGPIAIIYFAQVTGSYALGLGVYGVVSIAVSIFEVPTGVFSDMIGRKRTMMLGAISSALGLSLYAIGGSFWMLAAGSVFIGLTEALFSGNNDALLYDSLREEDKVEEYSEWHGKVGAMFQIGLGVSALIGGFIAEFSFAIVLWVSVIPQVINIFLAMWIVEPKRHSSEISTNAFDHLKEALLEFKKNWKLRSLSISSILSFGVGETMHQFVPAFYALLWPTWALGIPRMLSHVFGATSFHFAGRFIKRFMATKILLVNTFFNRIIGFVAFGFPTVLSPLIYAGGSLSFGAYKVAESTLMQGEFTHKQRATMSSLNNLFANILFAVFAFAFGAFADQIGPAMALFIGEFLLLPLSWIFWRLYKAR
jgi:MFS family permease